MYGYIAVLVGLSVALHFLGMFEIAIGDAPTSSHIIMTVLDTLMFFAIIIRGRIAFWYTFSILAYGVVSQTYWTIEAVVKHFDQPFLQGLTATLCWLALGSLIAIRDYFQTPVFRINACHSNL